MKRAICLLVLSIFLASSAGAEESVLSIQRALTVMGFFEGKLDGVNGEKTVYAVSRLVAYLKYLKVDADADEATRMLLAGEVARYAADASAGDTSENVLRVQRRLYRLGYMAYAPDGVYGDGTTRAVAVFQYWLGLPVTGVATRDTQEALFSPDAPASRYKALKKGDKGENVEKMQKRLALLGFFTGDIDAQYGAETSLGVKALQTYVMSSGRYDGLDSLLRVSTLDGTADPFILDALFSDDFELAPQDLSLNDSGQEVYRLQRRLIMLGYLSGVPDGGYGADTDSAVKAFKKAMSLKGKGCDIQTQTVLYSSQAKEAVKPYKIVINLSEQRTYIYAMDDAGEYTKLVSTMTCSTGPDAKSGSYRAFTRPDAKLLKRESDYLRFVFKLSEGLSISSIPYYDKSTFDKARLDSLGQPMSEGGVMLTLQNAKLIWEKCPAGTPVEIVE